MSCNSKSWLYSAILLVNLFCLPLQAQNSLDLDNVDVRIVAAHLGELTGKQVHVDASVKARISIAGGRSPNNRTMADALIQAVKAQGLAVVEREQSIRITTIKALQKNAPFIKPGQKLPSAGVYRKIIPVKNVTASSLKKQLESLVSDGADTGLKAFDESNSLLITDDVANIRRIEEIIAYLDQPGAHRTVAVLKLEHAEAEELAKQLNLLFKTNLSDQERMRRVVLKNSVSDFVEARIIASPRTNNLLILGTPQEIETVQNAITQLDKEPPPGKNRIRRIPLKYRDAESTAIVLNNLLAKKLGKDAVSKVAIEPDRITNSLIIDAPPKEAGVLDRVIAELDVRRPQVLIRAIIAEISTEGTLDLGIEFAAMETPENGKTFTLGRTNFRSTGDNFVDLALNNIFPKGLTFGIVDGTISDSQGNVLPNIAFLATAIRENAQINILAAPQVVTEDNQETEFNVVENIPILQSTIQSGSGTTREIIQNIQRIDVGIKLKLTPRINPDGLVRMELNPTIEAISDTGADGNLTPTIIRREVKTTVSVPSGSSIVISGLIRENKRTVVRKIPLLGDIPLLGFLFRRNIKQTQKTNLLIIVSPEIIDIEQLNTAEAIFENTNNEAASLIRKLAPEQSRRAAGKQDSE